MAPYLQQTFISFEIGVRKPHLAAYRHVLDRWPHGPETILFIDDKLINLQMAEKLGLHTHLSEGTPESWVGEAKSFLARE